MKNSMAGRPQRTKTNILMWKSLNPTLFEPRPLCSQKKIGAIANATKVGLLNIPTTVSVASQKQWFNECEGSRALSL